MHVSFSIGLYVIALFCCTDAAPRFSWGSFANFEQLLQDNKTSESCLSGRCSHWLECEVHSAGNNPYKICSNKSGGPWVCCMDENDVVLEHSRTRETSTKLFSTNSSKSLSIPMSGSSRTEVSSYLTPNQVRGRVDDGINQQYTRKTSSSGIPDGGSKENSTQLDQIYASASENVSNVLVSERPSLSIEGTQNEFLTGLLNRNGSFLYRKPLLSVLSEENETVIASLDETNDFVLRQSSSIDKDSHNETIIATVGKPLGSNSFGLVTEDKRGDYGHIENMPMSETQDRSSVDGDWIKVEGIPLGNDSNSNFFRRHTGRISPRSWKKSIKENWQNNRRKILERKSSASWSRATRDSWDNSYTLANRKSTTSWVNPTKRQWGNPSTTTASSVERKPWEHRTSRSWAKPTTTSQNWGPTPHIEKRSTKIRKTTPASRSWHKPTERPGVRDASVSGKSTISTPRRSTRFRSPITKSTLVNRRANPTIPTRSNPLPGTNNQVCGVRDPNSETSNRRRSGSLQYHPDSVSIYPNSRYSARGRPFQRIVGGTEAEPFSWPWVAALYRVTSSGGHSFLSAGSLISENFVLTAAHVFTPEDLRSASFVVMLGTHTAKEAVAEYPVMFVLRHPRYQQRFYYNDIALLRLERPVVFSNYVMPVCLPPRPMTDGDLVGKRVTVMGWGDKSYGGVTSRVLREASFPIVSRQTCNASYVQVASNRFPNGITDNMLCAGAPDGGKDACQGDSGGPLTTMENGRYTQVGIVSFGYRCGDKDYPGVYTRVASYLNWIADNAHCDVHPDY